jgi:hypothetical protein
VRHISFFSTREGARATRGDMPIFEVWQDCLGMVISYYNLNMKMPQNPFG